jgi:hypothetical protein
VRLGANRIKKIHHSLFIQVQRRPRRERNIQGRRNTNERALENHLSIKIQNVICVQYLNRYELGIPMLVLAANSPFSTVL